MADLCRMGDNCRGYVEGQPADDVGRGLCWPCERHGQHAIGLLADDWRHLAAEVGKDASRQGLGGMPTASRPEAPVPLRLDIDAFARQIAWTVETWEVAVRERVGLADVADRRVAVSTTGATVRAAARPELAVSRGVGVLVAHYSVLLALPPTAYLAYPVDESAPVPAELDGPGAVVELVDLHYRALAVLGMTRRRESRPLPCPPQPAGCGMAGMLGHEKGSGVVDCGNCGWWCSLDEYAEYTATFQPPPRRRVVAGSPNRPMAEEESRCP